MQDLIERLEKATGPDYRLSKDIGEALGMPERYEHSGSANPSHRHYTSSIDAALTLVPEPVVDGDRGRVVACRFDFGRKRYTATVNYDHHAVAQTPATAILAAALKARNTESAK